MIIREDASFVVNDGDRFSGSIFYIHIQVIVVYEKRSFVKTYRLWRTMVGERFFGLIFHIHMQVIVFDEKRSFVKTYCLYRTMVGERFFGSIFHIHMQVILVHEKRSFVKMYRSRLLMTKYYYSGWVETYGSLWHRFSTEIDFISGFGDVCSVLSSTRNTSSAI
jgi:hypothetical protein